MQIHSCLDLVEYVTALMPLPEPYKEDEHD